MNVKIVAIRTSFTYKHENVHTVYDFVCWHRKRKGAPRA